MVYADYKAEDVETAVAGGDSSARKSEIRAGSAKHLATALSEGSVVISSI